MKKAFIIFILLVIWIWYFVFSYHFYQYQCVDRLKRYDWLTYSGEFAEFLMLEMMILAIPAMTTYAVIAISGMGRK